MPKKITKQIRKGRKQKTKKQKLVHMVGCNKNSKSNSKTCKNKKIFSSLGKKPCPNCGPKCRCGPTCNCIKNCPGTCYLNRSYKKTSHNGGAGCGSCGCPIPPMSTKEMNQFGGYTYPPSLIPKSIYAPVLNNGKNGPIVGSGQIGGCGCGLPEMQSGGSNFYKPAPPVPGPFTGSAWGASINKWPGMNDVGGDRNYLKSYDSKNNIIVKDPALQMTMNDAGYKTMNSKVGGYTYKKNNSSKNSVTSSTNSIKGGGLVPQDLVNLGRDFSFNLKSAYNSLNGYSAPTNPLPYKDQLRSENSQFIV